MSKPPKIVCIGAGSAVFGLSNLASIIRSGRLRGSEIVLVDIDEAGLETITALAHLMNQSWDSGMWPMNGLPLDSGKRERNLSEPMLRYGE